MDKDEMAFVVSIAMIPLGMALALIWGYIDDKLWKRRMAKARAAEAENPATGE